MTRAAILVQAVETIACRAPLESTLNQESPMSTKINVKEDPRFMISTEITGTDGVVFTSRRRRQFMVPVNHLARNPDARVPVEIVDGWVTSDGLEVLVPSSLIAGHCRVTPDTTYFDRLEEIPS
jgi:hypothetical protein